MLGLKFIFFLLYYKLNLIYVLWIQPNCVRRDIFILNQ